MGKNYCLYFLPWRRSEDRQLFWSALLSSPIRVTILRCSTSVKRGELGYQVWVSNDTQAFLSQNCLQKKKCAHFMLLFGAYLSLCLSLSKYNGLWSKCFSDCYYTEYRWTAVNLCCKSRALSKFLFWLDHSPSSRGDGMLALNFCIGFNGNLLQGSCEYGSVSLLIA